MKSGAEIQPALEAETPPLFPQPDVTTRVKALGEESAGDRVRCKQTAPHTDNRYVPVLAQSPPCSPKPPRGQRARKRATGGELRPALRHKRTASMPPLSVKSRGVRIA
eukprot:6197237-Pleurochrysis_carterae.AAC.4